MGSAPTRIRLAKLTAGIAVAMGLGAAIPAQAAPFTYAGYTFDQDKTPDMLGLLGNGDTLGGATFSSGTVSRITRSVGFNSVSGTANAGFVGFLPCWRSTSDGLWVVSSQQR